MRLAERLQDEDAMGACWFGEDGEEAVISDENEIAAAVSRLLADPRFRAAACHLGDAVGRDLTSGVLVSELESIVGQRRRRAA